MDKSTQKRSQIKRKRGAKYQALVPAGSRGKFAKIKDESVHDQAAKIAQYIMLRTVCSKDYQELHHYIGIHSDVMWSLFGRNPQRAVKVLVDLDILEVDHSYCIGSKDQKYGPTPHTKGYRLKKKSAARNLKFTTIELYRAPKARTKDRKQINHPVYDHLVDHLSSFSLSDDLMVSSNRSAVQLAIEFIKRGYFYGSMCSYGRLHTNYTSLPRDVRAHLSIESGEPLVEMDIANSQPLILGLAIRDHLGDAITPKLDGEIRDWTATCEAGQAYEEILNVVHTERFAPYEVNLGNGRSYWINPQEWTRDNAKKSFLVMLFHRVPEMVKDPTYKSFQARFPALAEAIIQIKKHEHQALARMCQRTESKLMIERVGGEMMIFNPESPVTTIHDCWITSESLAPTCVETIQRTYESFGVRPTISSTPLVPGDLK